MSNNTRSYLLSEAKNLMRTKGYSAFSFADLAKKLGITKASVHYYFATKDILVEEAILEAIADTKQILNHFYQQYSTIDSRLKAYSTLFLKHVALIELPLCASLSAELNNLPQYLRSLVQHFFNVQLDWLNKVIQAGQQNQEIPLRLDSQLYATRILNLFEGSSIVSHVFHSSRYIEDALTHSLEILHNPTP